MAKAKVRLSCLMWCYVARVLCDLAKLLVCAFLLPEADVDTHPAFVLRRRQRRMHNCQPRQRHCVLTIEFMNPVWSIWSCSTDVRHDDA